MIVVGMIAGVLVTVPVTPDYSAPDPVVMPADPEYPTVWDELAECESHGEWDYDPATATWGTRIHEGGVQFAPSTWDAFRLDGYPDAAYDATREQQIAVAERVLDAQGWAAWPACSRKMGLR